MLDVAEAGRRAVAARCEVAAAAGVRVGHTLAEARARLAGRPLLVRPHDRERDEAALRALAAWAHRFAPTVALDLPSGLLLDVAGCERLFGGERRLATALRDGVVGLGFRARVAVASTVGCAWALARFGRDDVVGVPSGGEREALEPLPLPALRVGFETVEALAEVGVTSIGELLALPRETLSARFPSEVLRRLDQALGTEPEPLRPFRPKEPPRVERAFAGPVSDVRAIRSALRALLEDLAAVLASAGRGALALDVVVERSDAAPLLERVALSRPSCDARHLAAVLDPRRERWNLGYGVDALRVVAVSTRRLPAEQSVAWPGAGPAPDRATLDRPAGEVLDALASRCGRDGVLRFEPVESHVPERAFRARPASDEPQTPVEEAAVTAAERPSILLESPEPAEVVALLPDGPPARLVWRGESTLVAESVGPERISPPWWPGAPSSAEPTRDYFRVCDDRGRWLWIFRESLSRRWFVHGEWA